MNKSAKIALVIVALAIVFSGVYVYVEYMKFWQEKWDAEVAYYVELAESKDWLHLHYGTPESLEYTWTWNENWVGTFAAYMNYTRQGMLIEMEDYVKWQEENGVQFIEVGLNIDEIDMVIFFQRPISCLSHSMDCMCPGSTKFICWPCPGVRR